MSAPDFSKETVEMIAYRSAYICANPNCNRLTMGPSITDTSSKIKIGEAAHIYDAREQTIRFDKNLSAADRAKPENGIWLCSSCHKLIDKNNGKDFPATLVKEWKGNHEELIANLLLKHKSPLPLLRRFTEDMKRAQKIVDTIANKGAFFVDHLLENQNHVLESVKEVRRELMAIGKRIDFEKRLKEILKGLNDALQEYMNMTSKYPQYSPPQMEVLRQKVGIALLALNSEYGCDVTGSIRRIMPK